MSTFPGMDSLNLCYSNKKKDSKEAVMANRVRLAKAAGIISFFVFKLLKSVPSTKKELKILTFLSAAALKGGALLCMQYFLGKCMNIF